jgi:hypothetical protein
MVSRTRMIAVVTAGAGETAANLEARADTYLSAEPLDPTVKFPPIAGRTLDGKPFYTGTAYAVFEADDIDAAHYLEWLNLAGGASITGDGSQTVYARLLNHSGTASWYQGEFLRPEAAPQQERWASIRRGVSMRLENLTLIGGSYVW